MTVWLVRDGKYGEREMLALEQALSVIGWEELPDLSKVGSCEAHSDSPTRSEGQ